MPFRYTKERKLRSFCDLPPENGMTENAITLQPGPVFYEVFLGALMIYGTNLKEWAASQGYEANNAKMAATGSWKRAKLGKQ